MYKPRYVQRNAAKTITFILTLILILLLVLTVFLETRIVKESTPANHISGIELMPWEAGGKQPSDYTWEEYLALDDSAKDPFFESFASSEDFDAWMASSGKDTINSGVTQELPWESGGKPTDEYTWEEYVSLDDAMKDAFFESFASAEEFDAWMLNSGVTTLQAEGTQNAEALFEGKLPNEYSWEEYASMAPEDKDLFFESFESPEAFELWLNAVNPPIPQSDVTETDSLIDNNSWNTDNKPLNDYTWDEFESLTPEQQEDFFLSFASADDFEEWMFQSKL